MAGWKKALTINDEHRIELSQNLKTVDDDLSFDMTELKEALDIVGIKKPQYQVRILIDDLEKSGKTSQSKRLSFQEFENLCAKLQSEDPTNTFKSAIFKRNNFEAIGGNSTKSSEGTTHSVRQEEQVAFSDWINSNLEHDPDLKHILPIDLDGRTLYDKVEDGILLCKIINHSCPATIDERAINKKNLKVFEKHENLTLALNSAQAIGCNIINIGAQDLMEGKPHLVLGLLWQIIRIGLFNQITLEQCPGLVRLLLPTEDYPDLNKLSPETILLRWVNYHLEKAGISRHIENFTGDIKDSEAYLYLLKQIAPHEVNISLEGLREPNLAKRAERMLQEAEKLGCRRFLAPNDVVQGVYKLNLAFVANLFNTHPGLDRPDQEPIQYEHIEETREEKTYRNWMNSMGVKPYVNWLYSDLADGLVIFQLFDIIKPGIVDWKRVHQSFTNLRGFMERIENCNYAVELGNKFRFSLVGIAGQDLAEGNATLTLALIWQLMRAYTLTILTDLASADGEANGEKRAIAEKEIVSWVNNKLKEANKPTSINNFQDKSISTARPVIDLIDAIKPGSINYDQVLLGETDEEKLANAKYAISIARKIGARIYALPEDIVEVKNTSSKSNLIVTVFACLMARDYIPNMRNKTAEQSS